MLGRLGKKNFLKKLATNCQATQSKSQEQWTKRWWIVWQMPFPHCHQWPNIPNTEICKHGLWKVALAELQGWVAGRIGSQDWTWKPGVKHDFLWMMHAPLYTHRYMYTDTFWICYMCICTCIDKFRHTIYLLDYIILYYFLYLILFDIIFYFLLFVYMFWYVLIFLYTFWYVFIFWNLVQKWTL